MNVSEEKQVRGDEASRPAALPKPFALAERCNLTEIEVDGLKAAFTFADGHAYHDMPTELQEVMNNLPQVWREACDTSVPAMEERFKQTFGRIVRSTLLGEHKHFSLCPTASNSIDIVAAWLASHGHSVGLLEPTFDNLYLLLKRRKVNIVSVQEEDLLRLDVLRAKIKYANLQSILVVSPNNPTGFQLDEGEFRALCEVCTRTGVTLILDATFRFYSTLRYDEYRILAECETKYILIEDTGKTWPTQDTKVSLMACSPTIADELRALYEEVYLCHSNFAVALLNRLVDRTERSGLESVIWQNVAARRAKLIAALRGSALSLAATSRPACALPVVWLDCSATGLTDMQLVRRLAKFDVALLPGRFFFWNSQAQNTNRVRVSLLRSDAMLEPGLRALKQALQSWPHLET